MLETQEGFAATEKDHVAEAASWAERLDEWIAAIGCIPRERMRELRPIMAIFCLEKTDAAVCEAACDAFRIAPFEDARETQILGWILRHRAVLGLPCGRHRHADLPRPDLATRLSHPRWVVAHSVPWSIANKGRCRRATVQQRGPGPRVLPTRG